jgi:Spy/CpxP family protein refolding chaperone
MKLRGEVADRVGIASNGGWGARRTTMLGRVARVRIAAGGNLLRRMMYWTVALGGVLSLGMNVAAVAQSEPAQPRASNQTQAPQQGASQQGAPQPPTTQEQMARITQMLSLTDAQQQQVYPLLQQAQAKMQALVADTATPIADRQAQAAEVRQNLRTQIAAVLTPEQKQKLDSMTHHGPGGAGTAPAQPQSQPPSQPQK